MKKVITLLSILLFGIFSISSCSNSGSNDSNEKNNGKSEEIADIEKMIGFDPNTPLGSYLTRNPSDFCKGFSKKYDDEYNQVDESKTIMEYKNPNDKSCNYLIEKYNSLGYRLYYNSCGMDTNKRSQTVNYYRLGFLTSAKAFGVVEKITLLNLNTEEEGNMNVCVIEENIGFKETNVITIYSPNKKCNVSKGYFYLVELDKFYYYIDNNEVTEEEYYNTCSNN